MGKETWGEERTSRTGGLAEKVEIGTTAPLGSRQGSIKENNPATWNKGLGRRNHDHWILERGDIGIR